MIELNNIYQGDVEELLKSIDSNSVDLIVISLLGLNLMELMLTFAILC